MIELQYNGLGGGWKLRPRTRLRGGVLRVLHWKLLFLSSLLAPSLSPSLRSYHCEAHSFISFHKAQSNEANSSGQFVRLSQSRLLILLTLARYIIALLTPRPWLLARG